MSSANLKEMVIKDDKDKEDSTNSKDKSEENKDPDD